jgi:hypothetical protein
MPLIECKLGPIDIDVAGNEYQFKEDRWGRAVCEVHQPIAARCFLAVEHYREVPEEPDAETASTPEAQGEAIQTPEHLIPPSPAPPIVPEHTPAVATEVTFLGAPVPLPEPPKQKRKGAPSRRSLVA